MSITRVEVERIATLARLRISEDETLTFAQQLSAILNYVEQLKAVGTDGVDPMATVLAHVNVLREDIPEPSLPVDAALANAPDADGGAFRVPRIIESR